MAYEDNVLLQNALLGLLNNQQGGGLAVAPPVDTNVISEEQIAKDIALQKILDSIQAGQANMPKGAPSVGNAPAFTPQPAYSQDQNALVGALASLAGGGLKAGNSAPQATMIAPAINPLDKPNPSVPVKPVVIPVDKEAAKDPRLEALNKGFLEEQYRPSETAKAMGASDRTIQATRQPNGTIAFTNIGTKSWAEIDAEKGKDTKQAIMGTSGVTPDTTFAVGNIKKVKDSLFTERDPAVIANTISNLKTSGEAFLNKMVADEIGKQEMLLGLPAMQMELAQARVLDQRIAATNPAGAVNARNVLMKMEQVRSNAAKSAESALARNMTYVSVKSELEGFDKDPLVQTAVGALGKGIGDKFEAEELAKSFSPTEKDNAILVWNDAVDKDNKPDYAAIASRYKRLPDVEKAMLRFSPYEAAQVAIADPSNSTANAMFTNALVKDGFSVEEAKQRVSVAQSMVKDPKSFKIAYDAVIPKAQRVEGDSILLPDNTKKKTEIEEDNLRKAMIVRDYMTLERTKEFVRKADNWLGLYAQDDPALAKALNDVKVSGKEATLANVAALYFQGTEEEQIVRRKTLQALLTKTMQGQKRTTLGALNLQQALNEIPALAGPDPWYAQISKLSQQSDPLAILKREEGKLF